MLMSRSLSLRRLLLMSLILPRARDLHNLLVRIRSPIAVRVEGVLCRALRMRRCRAEAAVPLPTIANGTGGDRIRVMAYGRVLKSRGMGRGDGMEAGAGALREGSAWLRPLRREAKGRATQTRKQASDGRARMQYTGGAQLGTRAPHLPSSRTPISACAAARGRSYDLAVPSRGSGERARRLSRSRSRSLCRSPPPSSRRCFSGGEGARGFSPA